MFEIILWYFVRICCVYFAIVLVLNTVKCMFLYNKNSKTKAQVILLTFFSLACTTLCRLIIHYNVIFGSEYSIFMIVNLITLMFIISYLTIKYI